MYKILYGWGILIAGLLLLYFVDYKWRMLDGDIHTGGFPENILFFIEFILGLIFIYFVYQGSNDFSNWISIIFSLLINLVIAFVFYAVITILYVVGSGIDSI
jgi:hypothetical protein